MSIMRLLLGILVLVSLCHSMTIYNVHISLSGDPTQMWVSFKTLYESSSQVLYGTSPGSYQYVANGSLVTNYDSYSGFNHHVLLTSLTPNTTYYYIAGDTEYGMSDEFNFTAAPVVGSAFSVAVFGDLGLTNGYNTSARLVSRATNNAFDWILHMGDIAYANESPWEYEKVWDEWFTELQPAMAHLPYQTAVGNHEVGCGEKYCSKATANFTVYKDKFSPMASFLSGTNTNMFYSFDYLNVHFIVLSTETDYLGSPHDSVSVPSRGAQPARHHHHDYEQMNWLVDDLEKAVANRASVPWIIVTGHRGIYSDVNGHAQDGIPQGQCAVLQAWLEPLFKQYSVDLYLAGHQHSYSRTYPVYESVVSSLNFTNPSDTVHVVAGGAGNVEPFDVFDVPIPDWQVTGVDNEYGYGVLTVVSDEELWWEYRVSSTDQVVDSFTLIKTRS